MYRHRGINNQWVEFADRDEAIRSASAMVRVALLFNSALVWNVDRQTVAFVTKDRRLTDDQLRERFGRFIQIVRV